MVNEATFSVSGYVATQPKGGWTRDGTRTVFMRLGWTPRRTKIETIVEDAWRWHRGLRQHFAP